MDFSLGPEQRDIRTAVRSYLDAAMPGGPAGDAPSAHGEAERLWKQMSQDFGLTALLVPERFGGLGLSTVEIAVVGQELGRHVFRSPFLSTAAQAAATLSAVTDERARTQWLPAIAAGELRVAVALQEDPRAYRCLRPSTVARGSGDAFVVTGVKHFVLDAADAGLFLALADLDGTPALFAIDGPAGVEVRLEKDSLDPTLRLTSVRFDEAPASLITGDCLAAIARGLDVLVLAQAAMSLG
jgi:alkylation response protein AidB-like acyl-CoA dehydrogenase